MLKAKVTKGVLAVLLLVSTQNHASAELVFAITQSDLLQFDSATPNDVTVVGTHGLATNDDNSRFRVRDLAWNYDLQTLYTIIHDTSIEREFLYAINPLDATPTMLAEIDPAFGFYEGLSFSGRRGLVVSHTNNDGQFNSKRFSQLGLDGSVELILENGMDNDSIALDLLNDRVISMDGGGGEGLIETNLETGDVREIGSLTGIGTPNIDAAIGMSLVAPNTFLAAEGDNRNFYRFTLEPGGDPENNGPIGVINTPGGVNVRGITSGNLTAIPEPSATCVFLLIGTLVVIRSRRRTEIF